MNLAFAWKYLELCFFFFYSLNWLLLQSKSFSHHPSSCLWIIALCLTLSTATAFPTVFNAFFHSFFYLKVKPRSNDQSVGPSNSFFSLYIALWGNCKNYGTHLVSCDYIKRKYVWHHDGFVAFRKVASHLFSFNAQQFINTGNVVAGLLPLVYDFGDWL